MDRIIFAWDCDAGVLGHIAYAFDMLRGRSCSLCDLSYAGVRPSAEFNACRASLPLPVDTLYRDELPEEVAAAIDGAFPAVVLQRGDDLRVLFGPKAIDEFADFAELEAALRRAVDEALDSPAREQAARRT